METIRFGRTGVQVPRVGVGTWAHGGPNKSGDASVGWTGHDDGLALDALQRAYDRGLTHWDTADVYGNGHAESLIGQMWARGVPRDRVYLASKVGWYKGDFPHVYHPELMRQQLEASLRNLRTDHVDLYYLHHCNFGDHEEYFDDANALIHRFREEGKIRHIGLSDWQSAKVMRFVGRVDPDVVQVLRHVTDDQFSESGLKTYCAEHDLGVAFFSPLRHGLLLGKYEEPTTFPAGDFRRNDDGFQDRRLLRALVANRDALRARWPDHPEPVLRGICGALLTDTPTGVVLVGMRNPKQVEAAAHLGGALSEADAAWVWERYRR